MALSLQRKIAAMVMVLYWPTLFVFAHIPIPQVVREADVSDKSLHFLGYLVLVYLLWFAVRGDEKVNWRVVWPWLIFAIMAVYGVLDEWTQNFVAGRTCDIEDFLADVAGTVTGLVLFSVVTFWPAGLLVTAAVIFGMTNVTRADLARLMPVTSAAFHLFAYAVFTGLWIQYMKHLLPVLRTPRAGAKWLMAVLAGPAALLLIVKLFSLISGRVFAVRDMLISAGGVGAVVAVTCLIRIVQRGNGRECQTEGAEG
jgi:VanZ family protein